jgi:hypothetical protein
VSWSRTRTHGIRPIHRKTAFASVSATAAPRSPPFLFQPPSHQDVSSHRLCPEPARIRSRLLAVNPPEGVCRSFASRVNLGL